MQLTTSPFCEHKLHVVIVQNDYLVISPRAFGNADVGCFRDDDTLRRAVMPTSGFDDLILDDD